MEQIVALLRVNGKVPRRAVILGDGSLGDKVFHPDLQETEVLSRVCEICRGVSNQPVISRKTAQLVEQALSNNCVHAWEAIRDDLMTCDLDVEAAVAVLNQTPNPTVLMTCLVGARDNNHMVHIACLLARTLPSMSEEAKAEMGRAVACQLRAVMDSLAARGCLMTRDIRDAVLTGFGKIIGTMHLPDAQVAECVLHAMAAKKDELLRLFLDVSPSFIDHRPQILPMLVDRARTATTNKYPLLVMLARILAWRPDILNGHDESVALIVCNALADHRCLDCRDCLAAAELVVACGTRASHGVVQALGRALKACSSSLIDHINL